MGDLEDKAAATGWPERPLTGEVYSLVVDSTVQPLD
jgi:hypothetical protein